MKGVNSGDPVLCPNRFLTCVLFGPHAQNAFVLWNPQSSSFCCGADAVLSYPRNVGCLLHSGRGGDGKHQGSEIGSGYFLANEVPGEPQRGMRLRRVRKRL